MQNLNKQKRVVSIQDISCFGKCSETVALPIISAAGIETVILPTAILSTHTGGFKNYTFLSLESQLDPISDHWKSLGLQFDGIITGYVGSNEMINKLDTIIKKLSNEKTIVMSDPAMADNGVLYPGFDQEYVKAMKVLCNQADIVIPNLTEATMMLGLPYQEGPYTKEYIEDLLKKLTAQGPRIAILTGVYFEDDQLGGAAYDKESGKVFYAFSKKIPGYYHGTGDIFASSFFAAYLNNQDLERSLAIAVKFVHDAIQRTYIAKTEVRNGVNFEAGLGEYAQNVKGSNE